MSWQQKHVLGGWVDGKIQALVNYPFCIIFRNVIIEFSVYEMQAQEVSFYERQKREARRILMRIENRRYLQVESERSEGLYIVDDLKDELRRNYKRSKTERMIKRMRRKEITENFRRSLKENNSLETFCQLNRKPQSKGNHAGAAEVSQTLRRGGAGGGKGGKFEVKQVLQKVVDQIKNSQKDIFLRQSKLNQVEVQPSNHTRLTYTQPRTNALNYTECRSFLPMLQIYIQQRQFLKTMSVHQKKNHIIITQMLLIALARRKNNKLLQALDILIQIDRYFPKQSSQMQQLKAVWYQLIAKLHIQIKSTESKQQKRNRWKKCTNKSSIRDYNQIKRQKTFIIRSIASKRNFLNRVQVQMKKVSLIYQSSYQRESTNYLNAIDDQLQERIVVSRINKRYAMSYPEPSSLFPSVSSIVNYGVIIINRDPDNKLFPNHYPNSLDSIISQDQYTSTFCKINSFLIPENRCFNYQTALYSSYESIFAVFMVILLTVVIAIVLIKKSSQAWGIIVAIVVGVLSVGLLSGCIHSSTRANVAKGNEVYLSINKVLADWGDRYDQDVIKFRLSEKADMIIISFPKPDELQEIASSLNDRSERSYTYSSKRKTFFQRSGRELPTNQVDQVIEKDDSVAEVTSERQQQQFEDESKQGKLEEQQNYQSNLSVSSDEIQMSEQQVGQRGGLPLRETLIIFDEFGQG